ncbi:glycosyltransferase [Clostridium perfringens]|uniref:glycosyltransferase n=1 Tax=Clostridium perfringens TaxID=1502 RepID=UPI001A29BA3B|nr:glycosyltransferase [Clostridium perfringens]MDK0534861.1 glycosyltransferase [Clostridium perfringens]MDM0943882.1 glycosyltransferase [Clostridium perfringens]MDU3867630.1 glycosyltransferase [Clostridium perfringens]MDU7844006.1 glycosyltransferase [Clostridium perfringens]HAT4107496.1 glycosyltransferase family 4 protein [Clostridium perfringens]
MIISFTCNNIGTGGAERVVCNLANQMARDGHKVRIICYEKLPSFYYALEDNVCIVELDPLINRRKKRWQRKVAGIINLKRLFDAVKGSDRVVSFYTRQNCYSILVCKLQRIPVICAERDHFFMSDGKINHRMRRLFYPHSDGFIHQTNMAREFLRNNEGVKCRDIVIPNPLWINDFPNREPVKGRVIAVGRLANQKNYEGMIRAFAIVVKKCPEAKLYIYGDGDLKKELLELVKNFHIDKSVVFAGITKNIVSAHKYADIYVMFSHGEGYPNALMEALAMGVPSISSDCPVGGPRDMISGGENGFLVPCGDEAALASRIIDLLESNELKEKFSKSAISIRESNRFDIIYNRYMEYIISCGKGDR